jgi:hypothetical protein
MPKETSLKEYMFAQDQRLLGITEKLGAYPDTELLQQYIQDQANQVIAFISTHDESNKSAVAREVIEKSQSLTNALLERVLWSLRFDEEKYMESAGMDESEPDDKDRRNVVKMDAQTKAASRDNTDKDSMESLLKDSDDSYRALLRYMQQSGKSGSEALHTLKQVKETNSR